MKRLLKPEELEIRDTGNGLVVAIKGDGCWLFRLGLATKSGKLTSVETKCCDVPGYRNNITEIWRDEL